ncbi:MAG TPA: type IV toxin-antitoxin system AbiEi family antitoxin domain-containing protein [Aldersonia sp.]
MLTQNLAEIADKQRGAFTWQQARVEYSRSEIRVRVDRGEWVRVLHGVYREASRTPTTGLLVEAARLSLKVCDAVACHQTAAALHGFAILDDPRIHVLASAPRQSRAGLVVHRDHLSAADVVSVRGTPATNAARTAVDMARTLDRLDAIATLDAALRCGVPHPDLFTELTRHARKPGHRQAAELIPLADRRAESPMESRTRLRCLDAGLPRPVPQFKVTVRGKLYRLDGAWPEHRIGLEYESGEWHTGGDAASRDNPRHNGVTDLGWTMFYATAPQVYRAPHTFTEPILRTVHGNGG